MSENQPKQENQKALKDATPPPDVPQFFRLNIEVGDLDQVLDVSSVPEPHPTAKALYFTVSELDAAYQRAAALNCVSCENVHDAPGGGIVVRPWGERSFYVEDPWKNPLCFVEEGTVYAG